MKTIDIAQAPTVLAEYAEHPGGEPAIVTSNGNPVAALLPLDDADLETVSLATNAQFLALIERSRAPSGGRRHLQRCDEATLRRPVRRASASRCRFIHGRQDSMTPRERWVVSHCCFLP